jgi:RNA polymerase sigma-70 factor (ECF subfamily)
MTSDAVETFEAHRALLFAIAYRMLSTVTDAEDMVQETFLRWQNTCPSEVRSAKAWLTTVITRLCINHLKAARIQREQYLGPWLPEPIVTENPAENSCLVDSLSMAFLVLLESLTPTERAVFLLREVFDYEFGEIATIVEKTEMNCRRLLSRARRHIATRRQRFEASSEQVELLLEQFTKAAAAGDLQALLKALDPDVTIFTDGGGEVPAARKPVVGASKVAHLILGTTRKFGLTSRAYRFSHLNGYPGFVGYAAGRAIQVIAFGIVQDRIRTIYVINNPKKLRHLTSMPG